MRGLSKATATIGMTIGMWIVKMELTIHRTMGVTLHVLTFVRRANARTQGTGRDIWTNANSRVGGCQSRPICGMLPRWRSDGPMRSGM